MSIPNSRPQMQALVQQESFLVFGIIGILLVVNQLVLAFFESPLDDELVVEVG